MTTSHAGHPLRTQRRCSAAPRTTVRPSAVAKVCIAPCAIGTQYWPIQVPTAVWQLLCTAAPRVQGPRRHVWLPGVSLGEHAARGPVFTQGLVRHVWSYNHIMSPRFVSDTACAHHNRATRPEREGQLDTLSVHSLRARLDLPVTTHDLRTTLLILLIHVLVLQDIALRTASPGPAHVPAVELKRWLSATAATLVLLGSLAAPDALAAKTKQPPSSNDPNRCSLETLDKFADTRRAFSQVRACPQGLLADISCTLTSSSNALLPPWLLDMGPGSAARSSAVHCHHCLPHGYWAGPSASQRSCHRTSCGTRHHILQAAFQSQASAF